MNKIKSIISSINGWMVVSFYTYRRTVNKIMNCCFRYGKIMIAVGVGMAIGYIFTSIGWLPCYQNQLVIEVEE
tara:strand:+ start:91 stop:309 length:219 start_codon:yes stop_codon:yes gene_type:complete